MPQVSEGDIVHVHYTGRFEDGTVFDSTREGDPLEFVAGAQDIIDGVSQGVLGMNVGEPKTITVEPDCGYGEHDPRLSRRVPLDALPDGIEVGDRVSANAHGHEIVFRVTAIEGEEAVIDANHPLAGKTLVFDLEVTGIFDEPQQPHDEGCGCGHDH
jgi:peptidylprolyl isomerase